MSTDRLGRRTCDRCARPMVKAHRVHKGTEYCGICYPRVFLRGACPTCKGPVRHHNTESVVPQCRRCERSTRVCMRCARPAPRARLIMIEVHSPVTGVSISKKVPVHDACRLQFLQEEECSICHRLSRYIQGASHLEDGDRACPSCVNSTTHATCGICRKHRRVVALSEEGRPLCAACSGDQPMTHPCPDCGCAVNGSGRSRCDACAILARLLREVELWAAIMEQAWVAQLYRDFGRWSSARGVLTPALPSKVAKSAPFFRKIDNDGQVKLPITATDLLRIFSSKELRANLNAMRFLCERFGFEIDEKARAQARDAALIARQLHESSALPWGTYLEDYSRWLEGKPLRTIAQYVGVARSFCEMSNLEGAFTQAALVQFLEKSPGARATISVWVSFTGLRYGWEVTMPPKAPAKPALRRDAARLAAVLQDIGEVSGAADGELSQAMSLLFEFRPRELLLQIRGVTDAGDLLTRDGLVRVPAEVKSLVGEWARRSGLVQDY